MRLLQVCNVGRIAGGTAACAWTITRALPDVEHHVHFISQPCPETERAFSGCRVTARRPIDPDQLAQAEADVVILHNLSPRDWPAASLPTIQYVHSAGARASADVTAYCSRWLAGQCGGGDEARVLYQAVPKPVPTPMAEHRPLREHLVVGRLCTPSPRKWPPETIGFHERLAGRFPRVQWEFVGCPGPIQEDLLQACRGRAEFIDAGWSARGRLWNWDALLYHHPHLTESFGRTCAESMRAGCVPVVDRRGGFVEQVTPETGFLCGSEAGFVQAIAALQAAGLRRRMSRSAVAHADRAFSLQRFRSDLLRLLRSVASSGSAVRAVKELR
jgi:hypothetical protein